VKSIARQYDLPACSGILTETYPSTISWSYGAGVASIGQLMYPNTFFLYFHKKKWGININIFQGKRMNFQSQINRSSILANLLNVIIRHAGEIF
jgi:hypothetical protein